MPLRRILMTVMSLGLLLPAIAAADTARTLALGGGSAYYPDAANVLYWYASLGHYPDLALIEAGDLINGQDSALGRQGLIGHGGGVHLPLDKSGRQGTLAFYFQDHLAKGPQDGAYSLFYARPVGSWCLGLAGRFSTYGNSFAATDGGDFVDGQYFHQYGLGLEHPLGSRWSVEAAGEIINSKISYVDALHSVSSDNWLSFGLRLRLRGQLSPQLTLVPVVTRTRRQGGFFSDVLMGTSDLDADLTTVGAGLNIRRDERTLVIVSGEYRHGSQDWRLRAGGHQAANWEDSSRDFYQIHGRVAVETRLRPWLTIRASVHYVRRHNESNRFARSGIEGVPARTEAGAEEMVATPLALGCGLLQGPVTLDFTWNDTAPVNPGLAGEDFLSGDSDGYSALSLQWHF